MANVADLIKWRDALIKARLSGVKTLVDSSGETVTYKSDREMQSALAAVERLIRGETPHSIVFKTSKGLDR